MYYDPQKHNRRSIRLKGYDYSKAGLFFVTINCNGFKCLFGKIKNKKMILNDAGKMIEKWYWKLESKFPDKKCHEMVVMPNHFHCIVENVDTNEHTKGRHTGLPLSRVIQWFKTMTTNEYIRGVKHLDWPRFDGKLWQRNYYEHIIRDKTAFLRISKYITENPTKWNDGKFNNK